MKKNNFYTSFLLLFIVFINCCRAQQNRGVITGTIEGLKDNTVSIVDDERNVLGTIKAVDGRFKFHYWSDSSDPRRFMIHIPSLGKLGNGYLHDLLRQGKVVFFSDSKKIMVDGRITDKNLNTVIVKGSPTTNAYNLLEAGFPSTAPMKKAKKIFDTLWYTKILKHIPFNQEEQKKWIANRAVLDSLYLARGQEIVDAVAANKKSVALAYIVYEYYKRKNPSAIVKLKNILSEFAPGIKDTYYTRLLRNKLKEMEPFSTGAVAADFTLKDSSGTKFRLSSLKGNYVLIDFWAAWCGPCRKEIPNVINAWHRFSNKGLKIIAVSIDGNKDNWINALKQEKMPYPQLLDEKKITTKLYHFKTIPYYVLVAPDGTIKQTDKLKGKDLEKTLEDLYSD